MTNLQALVTDGNVLCANEVKRIHMSREYEIENLNLQSDESNKTYINLLKSYKEMNVELNQSNKRTEKLKEELQNRNCKKKRKHQKANNYYSSKLKNFENKNTKFKI